MLLIKRLKEVEGDFMGYKSYSPIEVTNDVAIEVHANSMSNCTPQEDVPLDEYTHVELVIKKDNKPVQLEQVIEDEGVIDDFGLAENLDSGGQKYNFVPFEIVDKLYRYFTTKTIENVVNDNQEQVSTFSKEEAVQKINDIINALNKKFFEREAEIEGMLIALLSKQHVLLIGEPGTGKSLLSMELAKIIDNSNYFQWLLTKYTTPEELFGALSIKELEKGVHKRNVSGKLPEAELVFLDEIFKSNSAILNSLLTLINERLFYNNSTPVESPLITLVGASNEFPEEDEGLEAMYDRLLLRYVVEEIKDKRNFVSMLKDEGSDVQIPHITMDELLKIHEFVEEIEVPDKIYEDLAFIHQDLADEGIRPSARRMKNAVKALKAKAFIRGSNIVEEDDLEILNDILWNEPHEREDVFEVVKRYAKDSLSIILDEQEEVIMDIIKQVDEAGDDVNASLEAISKLKSIASETKALLNKYPESEDKIKERMDKILSSIEAITDSSLLSISNNDDKEIILPF